MSYTNIELARDLRKELAKGYNIIKMARFAFRVYQDQVLELSDFAISILMQLIMLEEGFEYELSEEEVIGLIEKLENSVDDSQSE